jgi:hypothetical protein
MTDDRINDDNLIIYRIYEIHQLYPLLRYDVHAIVNSVVEANNVSNQYTIAADTCIVHCTPLRQNRYTPVWNNLLRSCCNYHTTSSTLLIQNNLCITRIDVHSYNSFYDTKITTPTTMHGLCFLPGREANGHYHRHVKRARKCCLHPTLVSICCLPLWAPRYRHLCQYIIGH